MAPCYDFVRRTLVAVLVSLVASAATVAAQSMYLDANGDGVHTSADVVPVTGTPWTFDVWLVTDRNRDGSQVTCEQTADLFTLRGYSFVLRVANGDVAFQDVTNHVAELTDAAPRHTSTRELVYGRFSFVDLPPGRYRLATVTAQVDAGTPAITIEPGSAEAPGLITSFESACPGQLFYGLLPLGVDWFDVDGLPYGGQANRPPVLEPIAPMSVAEGDTAVQAIVATDPDGSGVLLEKELGPSYVRVMMDSQSPGRTEGRIQATPGYFDSGLDSASIRAFDGFLSAGASFHVTVSNVNRPPTLERPLDQEVEAGTTLFVPLMVSDPDRTVPALTFTGPPFSWMDGQGVLFQPDPREPEGTHLVTVRASDGEYSVEQTFSVLVFGTKRPPVVEDIEDMIAIEGYTVTQEVRAYDPDGDHLTFTPIQFPPFMSLNVLSTGPNQPAASIVLAPAEGDHGSMVAAVRVSDGFLTDERSFHVTVLERHTASTLLAIESNPRPPGAAWDRIRFGPRDGAFHAGGTPTGGVGVTFVPPTSVEQNWTVTLACLPAQRAECYSDTHMWQVNLLPPLGKLLLPGIYEHAGNVPDSTYGAIRIGQPCGAFTTCATTDSWFEVKKVQYSGGQLQSLWVRYARRCAPTPWGTYDLSGEIRYHAVLPVFTDPPTRVQAHAGAQLRAEILVGGTSPGTPTVTSPDLPVGAALTPVSNGRTFLEWTPALEDAGSYDIRLIASTAEAEPDTSVMTVCVDIPGALTATMDANRTEVITTNRGDASYAASHDQYGAYHPAGSGIPVANAAGFLVAARVDGEVRIAQGGCDFVPGPMAGGSAAPFEPRFKNYTIRRGEPFGYDWDHWPRDLGAPVDEAGSPAILGDATIWSLYNDARLPGPDEPVRWTQPLGIEVHQTTWAEASGTPLGDVVFQRYRIWNRSAHTLEDAYVAWEVNATTADYYGGHVAIYSRNASGCDTTLDLGYAYSSDDGGRPNAVGVAVVQGAGLTTSGVTDTLGLTAFQDRTYQTALSAHFQMRGYRSDGLPRHEFDDPSRPETPYAYSGDPVTGAGWLYPAHAYTIARFLASSGPFRLAPGEEQEVVVAIVAASSGTTLDAVTLLRASARAAKTALSRYSSPPQNGPPVAEAGGPYSGRSGVPVAFDGTASRDPEGSPLAFAWSFGDGAHANGSQPLHTYARDGSYPVVLTVSDGHREATDSTIAEIATTDTASIALLPGDPVIRLQSSRPLIWMSLEPRSDAFHAADISLESVALYRPERPDLAIHPEIAKAEVQDRDRDGIEEIALPFRKTDLRTLFADLPPGPNEAPVVVRGQLNAGGSFLAVGDLHVEVAGKRLTANVSPNPARGAATLTFRTSRPGPVRVSVYDVSGRLVRVLMDEAFVPTGYHDLNLAGGARALPSGIYFYRVEALEGTTSCRVLVLK